MRGPTSTSLRSSRTLAAWRRRRRTLRARLWNLLLGGDLPQAGDPTFTTVDRGASAIRNIRRRIESARMAIPQQYQNYEDVPFSWDGKITWDTSIISYEPWPGEPPQRAVLRVPKTLRVPAPAVLCFHGHMAGCLIGKEAVDSLAVPLAARGFVTLAPDAIRWGERRDMTYEDAEIKDWGGMSFYSERNLAMPLLLEGKTLLGAMIWEHMRAVDVLRAMKCVNAQQIGTIGWSMGAMQSIWLTAMDERVSCGVEFRGICSYKQWAAQRTLNALICFIPHILLYTDMGEIASLIAPRPYQCFDAASDAFFPAEGIEEVVTQVRSTYRLYGHPERMEASLDAGGHVYREDELQCAFAWLERWMQP